MTEVKDVIGILCRLLYKYGFTRMLSETFRKAKFDEDIAAESFWLLFAEFISVRDLRGWYVSENIKDKIHGLRKDDIMTYVKMALAAEGYLLPSFHSITTLNEHSRELLLAFGWYIVHTSAMENLVKARIEHAEVIWHKYIDASLCKVESTTESLTTSSSATTIRSKTDRLLWLFGKIHFALRNLVLAHEEKLLLTSQLHSCVTSRTIFSKGNSLQNRLFKNSKFVNLMISFLEQEIEILNLHVQWVQKENIFWKWMHSVLKLRQENFSVKMVEENHSLLNCTRSYCLHLMSYVNSNAPMIKKLTASCKRSVNETILVPENNIKNVKLSTLIGEIRNCEELYRKHLNEKTAFLRNEMDKITKLMDVLCIKPIVNNV